MLFGVCALHVQIRCLEMPFVNSLSESVASHETKFIFVRRDEFECVALKLSRLCDWFAPLSLPFFAMKKAMKAMKAIIQMKSAKYVPAFKGAVRLRKSHPAMKAHFI